MPVFCGIQHKVVRTARGEGLFGHLQSIAWICRVAISARVVNGNVDCWSASSSVLQGKWIQEELWWGSTWTYDLVEWYFPSKHRHLHFYVIIIITIIIVHYLSEIILPLLMPISWNASNGSLQLYASVVFRCLHKIAKSDYELRHVCLSVCPSAWYNSAPTRRTLLKSEMWVFFGHLSRKFNFLEDQCTFLVYLAEFFLEWEPSYIKAAEKIETHINVYYIPTYAKKSSVNLY